MYKTRGKKLEQILFGQVGRLDGGTPVLANMSYPLKNGERKVIYWPGNEGLIFQLIQRIEKLEAEVAAKTTKISK